MANAFFLGYTECALWYSMDAQDNPLADNYNIHDIASETLARMQADCGSFHKIASDLLAASEMSEEWQGHNFWLTRNRHGTGFWDRGLGEAGRKLTELAHAYGECNLYVGDDGMIYAG